MSKTFWFLLMLGLLATPPLAPGQEKTEPGASTIPTQVLQDDLLDKMAGSWRLTGKFEGQPMNHSVEALWVLNHQFLQIHEKDLNPGKPGQSAYDALVYVGYDASKQRYVAHWLDVFGSGSPTLGFGKRAGSEIQFDFEYPGQPWLTTFRWNAASKTWQWLMRTKDKQGHWTETADMTLVPTGR